MTPIRLYTADDLDRLAVQQEEFAARCGEGREWQREDALRSARQFRTRAQNIRCRLNPLVVICSETTGARIVSR